MKCLKILGATLLAVVALLFFARPAMAATEVIDSLNQQVVISQDGVANVTETIDYDFDTAEHHGIDRYYVLSSKNPDGKYYNLNFELTGVTQDGEAAVYREAQSGNSYFVRVGSSGITITGKHRYVLTYKMWPVVRQDPAGDYVNYDVTGNDWKVPILAASATVTLPASATVSQPRCYTGKQGSTLQDCSVAASSNTVQVSANSGLQPGQGLTLNALAPTGSFSQYLTPSNKPLYEGDLTGLWLWGFGIGISLLVILIGILIRILKYLGKRKSEQAETIVAQYEPPDGLLPAEMGILEDLKLTMREVTATIIDLAVKGHIKIRQVADTKKFEVVIVKPDSTGLQDYEKELFDLFAGAATEGKDGKAVEVSSISRTTSSSTIARVYDQIDARLRTAKYYTKKISGGAKAGWVGGFIIFVFVIPFAFGFLSFLWLVLPIASIFVAAAIASTPGNLTKLGYNEWAKVEGLKLYLTVAEKDRLNFSDAPKMNPKLFNKLLPSAIALGVEKEWAKQFEGMDIAQSTGWYSGTDAVTAVYLASVMSGSFNNSLATSFAPPASSGTGSSSGGFSGGGFSGGGSFGGGGGGSW